MRKEKLDTKSTFVHLIYSLKSQNILFVYKLSHYKSVKANWRIFTFTRHHDLRRQDQKSRE